MSALVTAELAYRAVKEGHNIGIATPYNAQSRLLGRLHKDLQFPGGGDKLTVATVHRFQGSERDIILFDTVEGRPCKPGLLVRSKDNQSDLCLSNVAIGRAKGKFAVIANREYIESRLAESNEFRRLLQRLADRTNIKKLWWPSQPPEDSWMMALPGLHYFFNGQSAISELEAAVSNAR